MLEVQRSDLAQRFNCVPSQINYVMSTRFSPERGYIVESRRGGNGYIRITRVRVDRADTADACHQFAGRQCGPVLRHGQSSATWCSPALWSRAVGQIDSHRRGRQGAGGRYREKSGTPFGRIFCKQVLILQV